MKCPHCGAVIEDAAVKQEAARLSAAMRKTFGGPRKLKRVARCGCKVMTLNRAKARGKGKEHKAGCEFYQGESR